MLKVLHNVIDIIIVLLDWIEEHSNNEKAEQKKIYIENFIVFIHRKLFLCQFCAWFLLFSIVWFGFQCECDDFSILIFLALVITDWYQRLRNQQKKLMTEQYQRQTQYFFHHFRLFFLLSFRFAFVWFAFILCCSALHVMWVKCQSLPYHLQECNKLMEIYKKKNCRVFNVHIHVLSSQEYEHWIFCELNFYVRYSCSFFFIWWFSRVSSSIWKYAFVVYLSLHYQNEKSYQFMDWMKEWKINRFLLVCLKSDKFMIIMHELIDVKM